MSRPCGLLKLLLIVTYSYTWIIHLHNGLPSTLRRRGSCNRVFEGVRRNRPAPLDRLGLLSRYSFGTRHLSDSGFRVEIVGLSYSFFSELYTDGEHSYRRTYMPETYHIAQEIQKYNIPDYRPRQEQYVPLIR